MFLDPTNMGLNVSKNVLRVSDPKIWSTIADIILSIEFMKIWYFVIFMQIGFEHGCLKVANNEIIIFFDPENVGIKTRINFLGLSHIPRYGLQKCYTANI